MPLFTSDVSVDSTVGLTDTELRATPLSVNATVSGSVTVANLGLTDAQLRATPVPISGTVSTTALVATTSNITQVVLVNNTSAQLLAANPARIRAIIYIPSQPLNIKLGTTASATSFTYRIAANNSTLEINGYTGRIDAYGSGQTVTITELS